MAFELQIASDIAVIFRSQMEMVFKVQDEGALNAFTYSGCE